MYVTQFPVIALIVTNIVLFVIQFLVTAFIVIYNVLYVPQFPKTVLIFTYNVLFVIQFLVTVNLIYKPSIENEKRYLIKFREPAKIIFIILCVVSHIWDTILWSVI
jgi:hypothetical protein